MEKKAYIYLRVSTSGQVEGGGFDRQEEECRRYAKGAGLEIAEVFKEEGVSGTTDETQRPAFMEMVSAILTNGVRTILVESLDRLARGVRVQESLVIYLAAKNIDLISVRTGENVTEAISADPLRRALIQVQAVFSELEKNQLVWRLRKGREKKKAETGRCEGLTPYGATDAEKAVIKRVRLMRRRIKGGYKGMTLQEIADRLNAENIPTRLGKQWKPQTIANILK